MPGLKSKLPSRSKTQKKQKTSVALPRKMSSRPQEVETPAPQATLPSGGWRKILTKQGALQRKLFIRN